MADASPRHPVTTLELFFDLVFVFTLTRMTAMLEAVLSWETVARVVLIFMTLFWMYGGYVWLTNAVPPLSVGRRLLMFAGMAAFLVCALAVPEAFGDTALAFGIGYLLVVVVHAGLYAQAAGRDVVTFAAPNLLHAALLIAASFFSGWVVYVVWVFGLVIDLVTPRLVRRAGAASAEMGRQVFVIDTDHFVERHGLLLLIALGESVVAVGIGAIAAGVDLAGYTSACLGLAVAACFWWAWFDADDELAEAALRREPAPGRVVLAVNGFFYAFVPMLLGVVLTAAGAVHAISHEDEHLDLAHAMVVAGGVATYLAGTAVFRGVMHVRPLAQRLIAAVVALGAAFVGRYVGALSELVALGAVLVVMLVSEPRPQLVARAGA